MKYGEKDTHIIRNRLTKEVIGEFPYTFRYAAWGNYHTNNEGDGLFYGNTQILGTCDFTVSGCKTEKAAIAKIRRWVKEASGD